MKPTTPPTPSGSTTRPAPTSKRWPIATSRRRTIPAPTSTRSPTGARILGTNKLPTNQGVLVGSYASVARMLDELAEVPGVRGVMMTFDDFVIGMEQFGTRIMPLMRCRNEIKHSRMNTAGLSSILPFALRSRTAGARQGGGRPACRPGWCPGSRSARWR